MSDISSLAKLVNLEFLDLTGNPLIQKDIDWLKEKLLNCNIYFE
ncbi:hypothetical protein [Rodentibacter heidelbergensis]